VDNSLYMDDVTLCDMAIIYLVMHG